MKKVITLPILLMSLIAFCQENKNADKKFVLVISGKQFHSSDSIQKEYLDKIYSAPLEVINTETKKQSEIASFQWVISVKDSNGIWKGNSNAQDYDVVNRMKKVVATTKTSDIVWVDELKFKEAFADLPKSFVFFIK